MKKIITIITGILIILLLTNCKKDDQKNLYVNESVIEFDYDKNSKTVKVNCIGSEDFSWNVSSNSDILKFSKTNGWCAKNDPDQFDILLQRQNLNSDSISASITISASTGESNTIKLFVLAFPEKKIRFNKTINSVAYDYDKNRLVILSDDGNSSTINILDIETNTFETVNLPNNYFYNFSMADDYSFLVAKYYYYDGPFIILDLNTLEFGDELSVPGDLNYYIVSSERIIYLFHYYYDIATYNIVTNTYNEYDLGNFSQIDQALIHPSGKYLYGTDGSRLIKINIENLVPAYIYAEYMGGPFDRIFITKDGSKILSSNKEAFHIDPELPGPDITETETIDLPNELIRCFDHCLNTNEYFFVIGNEYYPSANANHVYIYDDEFQYKNELIAEDFYFTDGNYVDDYITVEASIRYIFVTNQGDKIIIISNATSGWNSSWGIEILDR